MKRYLPRLIGLFVLVSLVFGVYFFIDHRDALQQEQLSRDRRLLSDSSSEFVSFSYVLGSADEVRLERQHGLWQIMVPEFLPTHSADVEAFINSLKTIERGAPIPSPGPASRYGLDEKKGFIRLSTATGEGVSYLLGDEHPFGGKRYLQVEGHPDIYLVDSAPLDDLKKGRAAFLDPKVIDLDPSRVSGIQFLDGATSRWNIEKRDGTWQMKTPWLVRANGTQAEAILSGLLALTWETISRASDSMPTPQMSIQLMGDGFGVEKKNEAEKGIRLDLAPSSNGSSVTVSRSDSPFRYRVKMSPELGALLDVDAKGLRQKEVFSFMPWDLKAFSSKKAGASSVAVEASKLSEVAGRLLSLSIRDFVFVKASEWPLRRAAFGLDHPVLTGSFSLPSETLLFDYATLGDHRYMVIYSTTQHTDVLEVLDLDKDLIGTLDGTAATP